MNRQTDRQKESSTGSAAPPKSNHPSHMRGGSFSYNIPNYPELSPTILNYPHLSQTIPSIQNYPRLSRTIPVYTQLSPSIPLSLFRSAYIATLVPTTPQGSIEAIDSRRISTYYLFCYYH